MGQAEIDKAQTMQQFDDCLKDYTERAKRLSLAHLEVWNMLLPKMIVLEIQTKGAEILAEAYVEALKRTNEGERVKAH